jgi:hypothetical protein
MVMSRTTALDANRPVDDASARRLRLLERPAPPAVLSAVPVPAARGWAERAWACCARWLVSARLSRM